MSPRLAEVEAVAGKLPSKMFIGGQHVDGIGGQRLDTFDPGTGAVIGAVPAGDGADIDAAVSNAKTALHGPWAEIMPRDRGRLLWSIGEAIRASADRFALIETLDQGKPLNEARSSIERTADYFCYYAGMVDKLQGETIPLGPNKTCFTLLEPIGVTGHIVPWNVPVSMIARGVAPALACGNTAVVKPAEDTPLSAILLAELMVETGLPSGVVNVVTGYGHEAGAALAAHNDVGHVTFTGSVATGKSVMTAAASHLASVTLELGGKSPHLVLKDADLERVVPNALAGVYRNAGQICSAGTRLLAEEAICDELTERLVDGARKMTVGHGLDNPDMGPLVSNRQLQTVTGYVERAKERGVEFLTGGSAAVVEGAEGGYFFEPTVAAQVPASDELAQEEVFGPVLAVMQVKSLDDAIEIANSTTYGLAAGIHTQDISKAMKFARHVEAGQVFINGYHSAGDTVPFGGFKQSGIGREKGLAALANYCETKAITVTT